MTKFEKIYEIIAKKIHDGELIEGDTLPSERKLMRIYDTSRDTIRKSLNLLIQNGYIQKSRGRKSIVLDIHRFKLPLSNITSFKEVAPTLGTNVETVVVEFKRTFPNERIQSILQIGPKDPIWSLKRVRKVDGEAVILDEDYLLAELTPGLTEEIAKDSIYSYFEGELGLVIAYADKIITCKKAGEKEHKYLDLDNYDILVNVDSYVHLEDARIFQYTQSKHRPDKFRFEDTARRIRKI